MSQQHNFSLPSHVSSSSRLPSYPLSSGALGGSKFGEVTSPGGAYSSAAKTLAASMQRAEKEQGGKTTSPRAATKPGMTSPHPLPNTTSELLAAASDAASAASAYLRNSNRSPIGAHQHRHDDESAGAPSSSGAAAVASSSSSSPSLTEDQETSAYLHEITIRELKRKHSMEMESSKQRWDDERRSLLHGHSSDLQHLQATIAGLESQLSDQKASSRASLVAAEVKLQSREDAHARLVQRMTEEHRAALAALEARHAEALSAAAQKLAEAEAFTVTAVADCEREWEGRLKSEVDKMQQAFSSQWSEREDKYRKAWEDREAQYGEVSDQSSGIRHQRPSVRCIRFKKEKRCSSLSSSTCPSFFFSIVVFCSKPL